MRRNMGQMGMGEMSAEMERCIENCMECHRICVETGTYCLQMGGRHVEANHMRAMKDCEQICATSADFMLRLSPLHPMTCGVCAEACLACAASCEQFGNDSQMQRCAEICRQCAQTCLEMAGSHHM
jgi:hypothetical protein